MLAATMKFCLVIVLLCLAGAQSVHAQESAVEVGVRGGAVRTLTGYDGATGKGTSLGARAGYAALMGDVAIVTSLAVDAAFVSGYSEQRVLVGVAELRGIIRWQAVRGFFAIGYGVGYRYEEYDNHSSTALGAVTTASGLEVPILQNVYMGAELQMVEFPEKNRNERSLHLGLALSLTVRR